MKCFASVDTFIESADASLKIGRLVANLQFLDALLRYGTFDQYHLFCPALENQRFLRERLEALLPSDVLSRVVLSHHLNFAHSLTQIPYEVCHQGDWHCYLPHLAHIRERYACESFPITGHIHSLHGHDEARKAADLMRAPLRPWDTIICTSSEGKQAFQNILGLAKEREGIPKEAIQPRLEVVPLGVPESAFLRRDPLECRSKLGVDANALIYLYLGRVSISSKGDLVPLLYAFKAVVSQVAQPKPLLVIAGGASQPELLNLMEMVKYLGLNDSVVFRPGIEDSEKQDWLYGSDVLVSPVDNLQETFGISIVEAMAAGLPVLATDFDGYRDLVAEGETGFRIPSLWRDPPEMIRVLRGILEQKVVGLFLAQSFAVDLEVLVDRMKQLALSADLRERMGRAGRQRAMERFCWKGLIPRFEALWGSLKQEALARSQENWPKPVESSASAIFDTFSHYPTRLLQDEDTLAVTAIGMGVLEGEVPMPCLYEDLDVLMPLEVLGSIVLSLKGNPQVWGPLRKMIAEGSGFPEEFLDFHALWLIKHGLLRRLAATITTLG